jgi:eukaryotic-like serine/threonine-protein kinase
MGFLIRKLIFLPLILLIGCSASGIKLGGTPGKPEVYPMFGKTFEREFFTSVTINDSLSLKWEAETNGSFPQSSVTYYGNNIFVNDLSGRVYCFDLQTGKIKGQIKHKGPVFTTPQIYKHTLIYAETIMDQDKSIFRIFNFIDGRTLADKEISGRVMTEMLMIENNIYFITERGLLYKFNQIGEQLWIKDIKESVHSSPVSDGKVIFISTDKGDILALDAEDGKILYRKKMGSAITSGMTVYKQNLFFGNVRGVLFSVNKNDGEINWQFNSGFKITATPVIKNDEIFIVNLAGNIHSVNASSGKENWKDSTGGVLNSTPLLAENTLIIPDLKNRILFSDTKNGKIKKILDLPNRAKLSPVITDNILIIGFDRGVMRAYEIL